MNRGSGTFQEIYVDGIICMRVKDKIYIGFGVKDKRGFVVVKDLDYDMNNEYADFIRNVKEEGFGKILYRNGEAHLYYDKKGDVRRVLCETFEDLCKVLGLVE